MNGQLINLLRNVAQVKNPLRRPTQKPILSPGEVKNTSTTADSENEVAVTCISSEVTEKVKDLGDGLLITYTYTTNTYSDGSKTVTRSVTYTADGKSYTATQYKKAVKAGNEWAKAVSARIAFSSTNSQSIDKTPDPDPDNTNNNIDNMDNNNNNNAESVAIEKYYISNLKNFNKVFGPYKGKVPGMGGEEYIRLDKKAWADYLRNRREKFAQSIYIFGRGGKFVKPSIEVFYFESVNKVVDETNKASRWTGKVRFPACRVRKGVKPQQVAEAKATYVAKLARAAELFSLEAIESLFGYKRRQTRKGESTAVVNGLSTSVVRPALSVGAASNANDVGVSAEALAIATKVTPKGDQMNKTLTARINDTKVAKLQGYTAWEKEYGNVFKQAYKSDVISDNLLKMAASTGAREPRHPNSAFAMAPLQILAKALTWANAGGLEFPITEGAEFVVPDPNFLSQLYVNSSYKNDEVVIPGLAFLRVHGVDKTHKMLSFFANKRKPITYKAVKQTAYNYSDEMSKERALIAATAYHMAKNMQLAKSKGWLKTDCKVLVPTDVYELMNLYWSEKDVEKGLPEYWVAVDMTWNYPRYNADLNSIRELVAALDEQFDRLDVYEGLRFVHGTETKDGFLVRVLTEEFLVTEKQVFYNGYAPTMLGRVLLYPTIDHRSVRAEEAYLMTPHDILVWTIIEFALVHVNRNKCFKNGRIDAAELRTTLSYARQGLTLFINTNLPLVDLEGSIDLDTLKKRHVETTVVPVPKVFAGTEHCEVFIKASSGDLTGVARPDTALLEGIKDDNLHKVRGVNAWGKKVGNTKKAAECEKQLTKECSLVDSGYGSMQVIVDVCNQWGLAVVVTDDARALCSMGILGCKVATLPSLELKKKTLVYMVTRFGNCKSEVDAVRYYSDAIGVLKDLEEGSDDWWLKIANYYVIPYSTKGAKIAKRLIAAHVAMPIDGTDIAGMQWADFDEVITERTGETIIAPTFNLSAPGIGYANTNSRDKMAAKYRVATKPALIAGIVDNCDFTVEGEWSHAEASVDSDEWNVIKSNGVWVYKGQEIAKFTDKDGSVISVNADTEGYLYEFSWQQLATPIFNVNYFQYACKLWNMANTVKLRDGIKLNAVWSNSELFRLNNEKRSWDLFVPADAFKEGDILWYFLPEAAATFRRLPQDFSIEVEGKNIYPRQLIRKANAETFATFGNTDIVKADAKRFESDTELMYLPQADLLGIYEPIREAFKAMFGQTMWVSYDNTPDLYEFVERFYTSAVKSNSQWRELNANEYKSVCPKALKGLDRKEVFAICDTETITDTTNIVFTWTKYNGEKSVAWRGWTYASREINGQWVELHYPIRVEYTTISQSVSDSKVMFGTTADLGAMDYKVGRNIYDAGASYHNRYVLIQSLLRRDPKAIEGVVVKDVFKADTIDALFSPAQLQALKDMVTNGNRIEFLKALAGATDKLIINYAGTWLYVPMLVSYGVESVNKASAMTIAGRAYEIFAHLILGGCKFGDPLVENGIRSLNNLFTAMVGSEFDKEGYFVEYAENGKSRCPHKESVLYGQQTVTCKAAATPDIAINRMYILKGSKMYYNFCKVFGKKKVATAASLELKQQMERPTLWVAPYRPPMTKAVAVGVVFINKKENVKRDFPLSGDRAYCSMFFMNFNMGDMDGDGISFCDVTSAVVEGRMVPPSMSDMFDFVEQTIGYDMTSVDYWNQTKPWFAEQYFADHFNIKPSASKEKRGPVLKKSLLTWDEWTTNVRGAIDQQTIFVGCSYKAQAIHTLLITLLRDVLQKDWCDVNTRDFVRKHFSYMDDEYCVYRVQAAYELALGGFDPNMAVLAMMALQQAWGANNQLSWYWNGTKFQHLFYSKPVMEQLHALGRPYTRIGGQKLEDAANSVGYTFDDVKMLLNIFSLAGLCDAVNKELAYGENGDNVALFEKFIVDTPTLALCLAKAQYILSTSRSEKLLLLPFVEKVIARQTVTNLVETDETAVDDYKTDEGLTTSPILLGMGEISKENIVSYLADSIRNLRDRAAGEANLTMKEVESVVGLFEASIGTINLEDVKEELEEVIINTSATASSVEEVEEEITDSVPNTENNEDSSPAPEVEEIIFNSPSGEVEEIIINPNSQELEVEKEVVKTLISTPKPKHTNTIDSKPMNFNRQVVSVLQELETEIKELDAVVAKQEAEKAALKEQLAQATRVKELRALTEQRKSVIAKNNNEIEQLKAQLAMALGTSVEELDNDSSSSSNEEDGKDNGKGGNTVTTTPKSPKPSSPSNFVTPKSNSSANEEVDGETSGDINGAEIDNAIARRLATQKNKNAKVAEVSVNKGLSVIEVKDKEVDGETSGDINSAELDNAIARRLAAQKTKKAEVVAKPKVTTKTKEESGFNPNLFGKAKPKVKAETSGEINGAELDNAIARRLAAQKAKKAEGANESSSPSNSFEITCKGKSFGKPTVSYKELDETATEDPSALRVVVNNICVGILLLFRNQAFLVTNDRIHANVNEALIDKLNDATINAVVVDYDTNADGFGIASILQ